MAEHARLLLLVLVACAAGCTLLEPGAAGRSPLVDAAPSPDSVGLEIFFARFPISAHQASDELWAEIDEQQIPAELRRRLAENGFRAGVVGARTPDALSRLLTLQEKPPEDAKDHKVSVEAEPTVTLRKLQVRPGRRSEVITSPIYDRLPLLSRESGQVRGRTYIKAEGRLGVKAFPETDGRVRLELTPELHHGEAQQRWIGSDGIIRLDTSRPKQVFDELKLTAALSPGQMLVMSCRGDRPGSSGHYFFTEPDSPLLGGKLLVLRLAQRTADDSFADAPPLAAEKIVADAD